MFEKLIHQTDKNESLLLSAFQEGLLQNMSQFLF